MNDPNDFPKFTRSQSIPLTDYGYWINACYLKKGHNGFERSSEKWLERSQTVRMVNKGKEKYSSSNIFCIHIFFIFAVCPFSSWRIAVNLNVWFYHKLSISFWIGCFLDWIFWEEIYYTIFFFILNKISGSYYVKKLCYNNNN